MVWDTTGTGAGAAFPSWELILWAMEPVGRAEGVTSTGGFRTILLAIVGGRGRGRRCS